MATTVQPEYTRVNVLTGQARRFYAPYDPTTPPVLPARTLLLNQPWTTPWKSTGATVDGLQANFQRNLNKIMIEEQSIPIAQLTKDSTFSFEMELSEDSFATWALAYGGGVITTTAPATGTPGYETLVISEEVVQYSFAFETANEKGYPRRVLIPIVVPNANVKTGYNRATKQRTYNVTLESLVPLSQCVFENVTLPGL